MSPHKATYCRFFNLTEADTPLSEISGALAQDVHAIEGDGMGGKRGERPIEELMLLTRKEHANYGGKKQYKHALYHIHLKFIQRTKPNYVIKEKYLKYLEEPEIKIIT